jgi:hypothetical protein
MNPSHPQRRRDSDDYQQDEAACFARHARPARPDEPHDAHYHQWRHEQMRARDEDYRTSRHDRDKKFSETFDQWRAPRPARSSAAGSRTLPPSIGTEPGQPNSASPGASGKNK